MNRESQIELGSPKPETRTSRF